MEKIIIITLAIMFGSFSSGNFSIQQPQKIRHRADKSLKRPEKPQIKPITYEIKDYDPH